MNVLYTCDDNYIWVMGISIISLYQNNTENDDLNVFLLGDHISDVNKNILKDIAGKYNRIISIIDIPMLDIPKELVSRRWPISAFTRLFSAELLPDRLDKILYLDCDTIINSDIKELESIDMHHYIFYGVKDCIGSSYKKNIGLSNNALYVNAGVLLIDLNELRKVNVYEVLSNYLKRYIAYINYADQDLLNGAFAGYIGILDPKYDVMTIMSVYTYEEIKTLRKPTNYYEKKEIINAISEPVIIHYTTNMLTIRPWYNNSNHPYMDYFIRYYQMSPWSDKKLDDFIFKTKESKIIRIIQMLPRRIANKLLGIIHSELNPKYIFLKAKIKLGKIY
ncbi:glycosyltransferase family 8 protein [Lacrimispora sp. BS-2]|uniref:Glycosyltransferase family 8 protein n=1 Tax=Lacrimispora sp. BS-2 TaxID=3151850 RepID=A0AAU7PNW2_9FIRM